MSRSFEVLCSNIATFIEEHRQLIEEGKEDELDGLKDLSNLLVNEAGKLNDTQRAQFAGRLEQLMGALTELELVLRERQNELLIELQRVTQSRKANTAYRTIEASDNFRREED